MKQIIQMEHNEVTNPNWKEANQLAIGQARTNKRAVRVGRELRDSGLQVHFSIHLATLLRQSNLNQFSP